MVLVVWGALMDEVDASGLLCCTLLQAARWWKFLASSFPSPLLSSRANSSVLSFDCSEFRSQVCWTAPGRNYPEPTASPVCTGNVRACARNGDKFIVGIEFSGTARFNRVSAGIARPSHSRV